MADVLGKKGTGDMEKQQGIGKERIQEDCLEEVVLSCLLEEQIARRMADKGWSRRGNRRSKCVKA